MTTHKQMSVSRTFCRSEKGWRAAPVKSFKKTKNRPLTPFSTRYSPKPISLHFHHLVIPLLFESSAVSPVSADTVHISQKRGAYEQSKIYGGVFLVGGGGVVLSNDRFILHVMKTKGAQTKLHFLYVLSEGKTCGGRYLVKSFTKSSNRPTKLARPGRR